MAIIGQSGKTTPRKADPAQPRAGRDSAGHLLVGRNVSFHGEIADCTVLTIEGSVDASLRNCRDIEIAPTGLFIGKADTERADISGRYEGNLVIRDRLTVRATGKVIGSVRYARLEVESGGEVIGKVEAAPKPPDSSE